MLLHFLLDTRSVQDDSHFFQYTLSCSATANITYESIPQFVKRILRLLADQAG